MSEDPESILVLLPDCEILAKGNISIFSPYFCRIKMIKILGKMFLKKSNRFRITIISLTRHGY